MKNTECLIERLNICIDSVIVLLHSMILYASDHSSDDGYMFHVILAFPQGTLLDPLYLDHLMHPLLVRM